MSRDWLFRREDWTAESAEQDAGCAVNLWRIPGEQMLDIISTLVNLLQPVLSALSGAVLWQSLEHWYFLLGLRLLAMYFASSSWESAHQDMACAWSPGEEAETRTFCTSVCYNRHFLDPVRPTWGFSFLIALLPITIIRMLYPKEDYQGKGGQEVAVSATCNRATKHRLVVESHVATRAKLVGEPDMVTKSNMAAIVRPVGDYNLAANPKLVGATNVAARSNTIGISGVTSSPAGLNMATRPLWHAGVFTVCIAALLTTEIGFLWALLARQLPTVSGVFFRCFPSTPACPPALECAVRGQPDKHMALVMLALTACISIKVCLGYGGVWVGKATCCHGRQEGEQALEVGCMREGSMCCDGCEDGEMGEGRVLRGDWESGEWDARMGMNWEWKGRGEVDKELEVERGDEEWSQL
ncbi:uncharacterized protein LOC128835509 [Malaclemys terrapin pileata]|uniref:uncharacterized protein LOC128835509 n=1 Tax=Malaclemys terrapin pileata TaxID=2991368 RepID=UPI0023A79EAE|nr:uncharacterized protein LOC128835509 [Malaclemys terrapin pileata]